MLTVGITRTAPADRINDGGRVVSFSKIAAQQGSVPLGGKAARESWNVGLAKEFRGHGIAAVIGFSPHRGSEIRRPDADRVDTQFAATGGKDQPVDRIGSRRR